MAGLGFKDFQVGEVLTAADVDGYLMQQSVMRFASDAARGSALGTAVGTGVALSEGMVSYLADTDAVEVYDGSAWTTLVPGIGSNVVQTVKTDVFTTTSAAFTTITGLTATITPSSASSKVLIVAYVNGASANATTASGAHLRLVRDSTVLDTGVTAGSRIAATGAIGTRSTGSGDIIMSVSMVLVDNPATTSATTYSVEVTRGGGGTAYINRTENDVDSAGSARVVSSITAIEVAA